MIDNFIVQTFGVSPMTFAIVVVFWAFVFAMFFGEGMAATFATCIFASITAWLIGKLGVVLFILLVAATIGMGIYFLFRGGDQTTAPIYQTPTKPNYNAFSGSSAAYATNQSYKRSPKLAPTVLYHGTSTIEAATDILTRNRWLVKKNYSPLGVYLTEDFSTAVVYAGFKGAVVEIHSQITSLMILEFSEMRGNSDKILSMGYRLIRMQKIFIAPIPTNTNGRYIRIEGLLPVRLLDRNRNPISSTFN